MNNRKVDMPIKSLIYRGMDTFIRICLAYPAYDREPCSLELLSDGSQIPRKFAGKKLHIRMDEKLRA